MSARPAATIVPASTKMRGFGASSTASNASPSRPIDVRPIRRLRASATLRSDVTVVVFPTFFAVPTTMSECASLACQRSKSSSEMLEATCARDCKDDAGQCEQNPGTETRRASDAVTDHASERKSAACRQDRNEEYGRQRK